MDHRAEIQDFLQSRRARLRPADVGLPQFDDRRRVAGLRREEVAMLAGVSVDYYARLERGQLRGVSDQVLDALATALRLPEAERSHLFDLARAVGPARPQLRASSSPRAEGVRPEVLTLLEAMTAVPAYVRNARYDILAANPLCRRLYGGVLDVLPVNLARFVFLDGRSHGFFLDWDEVASSTAAVLRAEAGRRPLDKALSDLIGELVTRSEPFTATWQRHQVIGHQSAVKRLRSAVVGELTLHATALEVAAEGLTMIAYTAPDGSPDADKLALLASWSADTAAGVAGESPAPVDGAAR